MRSVNVIGLGVDIVDVGRIARLLERRPRFVTRIFSPEEIAYCDGSGRRAECYAARWAAREACAKALGGIPGGRWQEIRVVRGDDGAVTLDLEGTARARAHQVGAERLLVSFAHERGAAVACCLAVGP